MNATISYSLLIGNPINIKWVLKSPSDLSFSLLDYELVLTIFNSRTKISIEPAEVLDDSLIFCLNAAEQHAMGPGSLSFQLELIEDSAKVFKLQLLDAFRLSIRQNQVLLGSPSGRVPSSPLTFESNLELVTCYRDSKAIAALTQQVDALQQAISTLISAPVYEVDDLYDCDNFIQYCEAYGENSKILYNGVTYTYLNKKLLNYSSRYYFSNSLKSEIIRFTYLTQEVDNHLRVRITHGNAPIKPDEVVYGRAIPSETMQSGVRYLVGGGGQCQIKVSTSSFRLIEQSGDKYTYILDSPLLLALKIKFLISHISILPTDNKKIYALLKKENGFLLVQTFSELKETYSEYFNIHISSILLPPCLISKNSDTFTIAETPPKLIYKTTIPNLSVCVTGKKTVKIFEPNFNSYFFVKKRYVKLHYHGGYGFNAHLRTSLKRIPNKDMLAFLFNFNDRHFDWGFEYEYRRVGNKFRSYVTQRKGRYRSIIYSEVNYPRVKRKT